MRLVDDTGYDAGKLADSWRQQPNSPAYCTELTLGVNPTVDDVVETNRATHR
ncbi:hypothetical protein [Streptomyces montanus]|uniref:hypothetical protein n=1 Tax=Streptomyces montanus TaxID=2580423 RepID=UPI001FE2E1C3|nr:hypothetical protein [Streptomyces montanus]